MSVAGQKKGIFDLHPAKAGQWPIVLKANGKFAREIRFKFNAGCRQAPTML